MDFNEGGNQVANWVPFLHSGDKDMQKGDPKNNKG